MAMILLNCFTKKYVYTEFQNKIQFMQLMMGGF